MFKKKVSSQGHEKSGLCGKELNFVNPFQNHKF